MKKLLLFVTFFLATITTIAQTEKDWEKVYDDELLGKTQSAQEKVKKIYNKAKRKGNDDQLIRSYLYLLKFRKVIDKDQIRAVERQLQEDIEKTSGANRSILQYIYAKTITDYHQQNQYEISRRPVLAAPSQSMMQWTSGDFERKLNQLQNEVFSDKNIADLSKIPATHYSSLIASSSKIPFDQNLFELLAYRWLSDINISSYNYFYGNYRNEISEDWSSKLLLTPDTFVHIDFSEFTFYNSIKLLQKIERESLNSNQHKLDLIALMRYQLFREWNWSLPEDEVVRFLENLKNRPEQITRLQANYFIIDYMYNNVITVGANQEYLENILEIIKNLEDIPPSENYYFQNINNIKRDILTPQLSSLMKDNLYENEHHRAQLKYKNIEKVVYEIYIMPDDYYLKKDSLLYDYINKNMPLFQKVTELKNSKSYVLTTTDILLPQLEIGKYLCVFRDEKIDELNIQNKYRFSYNEIAVSNLAVQSFISDNEAYIYVFNRKDGKPIEGAEVILQEVKFTKDVFEKEKYVESEKVYLTDTNGKVQYTVEEDIDYDDFRVKYKDDVYIEKYADLEFEKIEASKDEELLIKIFLDRAIYRPGQEVFFKAILLDEKPGHKKVLPNKTVFVGVFDSNSEQIESKEMQSNEWGSLSGSFILPKNLLNGTFEIRVAEKEAYLSNYSKFFEQRFNVEEYKRPTFEIITNEISEHIDLGSEALVSGSIKSFSGSNLSNIDVAYTVESIHKLKKDNQFMKSRQVKGVLKSDEEGAFELKINTEFYEKISEEELQYVQYLISFSATDASGETQTAHQNFKASNYGLDAYLVFPKHFTSKKPIQYSIKAKNLNGKGIATKGTIKVFAEPFVKKYFKKRVLQQPEEHLISQEDFKKYFPYESDTSNYWLEEKRLVYETDFQSEPDADELKINDVSKWKSGRYTVEYQVYDSISKQFFDEFSTFYLNNEDEKINYRQQVSLDILNKDSIIKDKKIKVAVSTLINDLNIVLFHTSDMKVIQTKAIQLNKQQTILEFPVDVSIKSKHFIQAFSVFDGDFEEEMKMVDVDADLMNILKINYVHINNKMYPGGNENWNLRIVNSDNNVTAAEVLSSMYDASLDNFKQEDWNYNHSVEYSYDEDSQLEFYSNSKPDYYLEHRNFYSKPSLYNFQNIVFHEFNWYGFGNYLDENLYNHFLKDVRIKNENKNKKGEFIVYGRIIDLIYGDPIPGASVLNLNSGVGTETDSEGYFTMKVKKNDVLKFGFLGFRDGLYKVSNQNTFNVFLEEDSDGEYLNDVVVNVYRTTCKIDSSKSYQDENAFIQTLQGQVPGINVTYGSGQPSKYNTTIVRGLGSMEGAVEPLYVIDGVPMNADGFRKLNPNDVGDISVLKDASATLLYGNRGANGVVVVNTKSGMKALENITTRKNLKETAFFFPHLLTDEKGNINISFESPEALTRWKFRTLAHNKKGVFGYNEHTIVTQKDLMIQPNMPRFFRENDTIFIKARVSNLTSDVKEGKALLQWFDATNMNKVSDEVLQSSATQLFIIPAKGSTSVEWKMVVPKNIQGLQYKIAAQSGAFTDAEENIIPVLSQSVLVTENQPIWILPNQEQKVVFEHLKNESETRTNQSFVVEYTNNPTWLAIQSLTYLKEYEHECTEQLFSRFFANTISSHIIHSQPKIKALFEKWAAYPQSKLEQNEELKNILLQETPWFKQSLTTEEQQKHISLLFDLNYLKNSNAKVIKTLVERQSQNGDFPWFTGGSSDFYVTSHIVSGFGMLEKMQVDLNDNDELKTLLNNAVQSLDRNFWNQIIRTKDDKSQLKISTTDIGYLYARSFYKEQSYLVDIQNAIKEKLGLIEKDFLRLNLNEKAQAILILNRFGRIESANKIVHHLKESAVDNSTVGMYWNENKSGWLWSQRPIETQALLIEAFSEMKVEDSIIEKMKAWLIAQKQSNHWDTTKSTTLAIYALLKDANDFESVKSNTKIVIANKEASEDKWRKIESEQALGNVKLTWQSEEINSKFAETKIENNSSQSGFGGVYWSYFENLDKIKAQQNDFISLEKKIFVKRIENNKDILQQINEKTNLNLGDLITVQIQINLSESMSYLHLKDLRASGFEPVDVLSGRKSSGMWASYYQSTKDAATHFFFDHLPKGLHTIEYQLRVVHEGNFSNGTSEIQNMYAPEYLSRTAGDRITVEKK